MRCEISRVYDVKTSVIARNVNLWPANLEYLTRTNTKHIFNSATIVCISGSLGSHQNILVLSACRHTRDFATHPQMMYLHSLPWHIHISTLGKADRRTFDDKFKQLYYFLSVTDAFFTSPFPFKAAEVPDLRFRFDSYSCQSPAMSNKLLATELASVYSDVFFYKKIK